MKKLIVLVSICLLLVASIGTYVYLNEDIETETNTNMQDNYKFLIYSGNAPSAYLREPTQYDVDTGIRVNDGVNKYALVESRTIYKKDFGKSFLARIN